MDQGPPGYACVWEYAVRPGREAAFEAAYGPSGPWARLFRRAPGWRRTELHRDRRVARRYLTIDYWESAEAWQAMRRDMSADYERIDADCADLTVEEREVGRFEPVP